MRQPPPGTRNAPLQTPSGPPFGSWALTWAASSRKSQTRENQDAWVAFRVTACPSDPVEEWGSWEEPKTPAAMASALTDKVLKVRSRNTVMVDIPDAEQQRLLPEISSPALLSPQKGLWELREKVSQLRISGSSPALVTEHGSSAQNDSTGCSTYTFSADKLPEFDPRYSTTLEHPWVFGVFDGHGPGGRLAATMTAQTFSESIREMFRLESLAETAQRTADPSPWAYRQLLLRVKHALQQAFALSQTRLLERNEQCGRDFGTTAIAAACLGRYVITASCGDSSAALFVATPCYCDDNVTIPGAAVNVQTNVDHSLQSAIETKRIEKEKRGRIVIGDGGVYRLIPSFCSYDQAKMKGLSINMARALGHHILSRYGLESKPEFTLLDIADAFQVLKQQDQLKSENENQKSGGVQRRQTLLFEARLFDATLDQKFPNNEQPHQKVTEKDASRTTTAEDSELPASETEDSDEDGSVVVVVETDESDATAFLQKQGNGVEDRDRKGAFQHHGSPPVAARRSSTVDVSVAAPLSPLISTEFICTCEMFLVLMSDGVSDVLTREELGDLILRWDSIGRTPTEIAHLITLKAETM